MWARSKTTGVGTRYIAHRYSTTVRSIEDLYFDTKKANNHLRVGNQIYARGSKLTPQVERTYLLDLISAGQSDQALELWAQGTPNRFWRSTGVLLKCKVNDTAGAELLASEGVHDYAEAEIARSHAKNQNFSEALQWLKGCTPQQREPVMNTLASGAFNSRQIREPKELAQTLASNPSILKDGAAVLRGLSGSRVKLASDKFWQKNHCSKTRSELLRQGITPKDDTGLTTERCLTLLNTAISECDHQLANKIFDSRPQARLPHNSNRAIQLELRYYQFKSDYASAFAHLDPPPRALNMLNWSLVWSIMRSFNSSRHPQVVAPDYRQLYQHMIRNRGIHVSGKTLNDIIEVFLRAQDFPFLLSMLAHWMDRSAQPLPSQTINFLSQRSHVPVHELRKLKSWSIVEALCDAYGLIYGKEESEAEKKARLMKYLF